MFRPAMNTREKYTIENELLAELVEIFFFFSHTCGFVYTDDLNSGGFDG